MNGLKLGVLALLAMTVSLGAGCGNSVSSAYCPYLDQQIPIGQKLVDGCNTCTCNEDTSVTCTAMACAECKAKDGQGYQVGETWAAGDGCNFCQCAAPGDVKCSEVACTTTCSHEGKTYNIGDTFAAGDDCNDCTCGGDGKVVCTTKSCACDASTEWWRDYASTDLAECAVIFIGCPENTIGFDNACGCGCEQDKTCPETFDCKPPKSCDVADIKKKCPYSKIAQ